MQKNKIYIKSYGCQMNVYDSNRILDLFKNQNYEIERFGTAALPYYVILSPEDEIISTFPGMTRKLNEFIDFLDAGLEG